MSDDCHVSWLMSDDCHVSWLMSDDCHVSWLMSHYWLSPLHTYCDVTENLHCISMGHTYIFYFILDVTDINECFTCSFIPG